MLLHAQPEPAGPRKEQPWHRAAAHMLVRGATIRETAAAFDRDDNTIRQLLRQHWFQRLLQQLADEVAADDVMALLNAERYASVMTLLELRDNPDINPRVRLEAARDILDRTLGKPTQRVESQVSVTHSDPVAEAQRLEAEIMQYAARN